MKTHTTGGITPVHQSLFPTKDSLDEAANYAIAQLPMVDRNELMTTLMIYQNTLLAELAKAPS